MSKPGSTPSTSRSLAVLQMDAHDDVQDAE